MNLTIDRMVSGENLITSANYWGCYVRTIETRSRCKCNNGSALEFVKFGKMNLKAKVHASNSKKLPSKLTYQE
jgi:hypothetical protein